MAVKMRLTRMGKKKQPFYRIVVVDSRASRDGKYIEKIGYYNPLTDPIDFKIEEDRALYWLQRGAIPTDTVRSLLRRQGILFKWDMIRKGYDPARIEEEMKKWEVIQIEKRRRRERIKQKETIQRGEGDEGV